MKMSDAASSTINNYATIHQDQSKEKVSQMAHLNNRPLCSGCTVCAATTQDHRVFATEQNSAMSEAMGLFNTAIPPIVMENLDGFRWMSASGIFTDHSRA
jgi:hypothetical protein